MADCKVSDVYTGIAGSHIKSFNSNGMVAIKDKEVTPSDVDRVIETARPCPIPPIRKSCTSSPRSSSSTARTASANPSA